MTARRCAATLDRGRRIKAALQLATRLTGSMIMASIDGSASAAVRARLNHPVIDSDGHTMEFTPLLSDFIKEAAGPRVLERFRHSLPEDLSPIPFEERHRRAIARGPWWVLPAENTRDLATAMFPKLLYERLDEMGMDFTVLYPSISLFFPHMEDEEVRRAACRAANRYAAEVFAEYSDRIAPVAVIPMHTPQEAIEELEYAVGQYRLRAMVMAGYVRRPIPAVAAQYSEAAPYAYRLDHFGLESEYDYDPLWAKCMELGVAPTFHSTGMGLGSRTSLANYMYNHIGHFAAAGEAICKALFIGGVTRRFPNLRFAFLEGGVGWAASLYADLIGHWDKRNAQAVEKYNPARIDLEQFAELCRQYGGRLLEGRSERLNQPARLVPGRDNSTELSTHDDWSRCGIGCRQDIADLFVPNFYFGCEADDPMNAAAFDTRRNPLRARLNAIFGSDIGHWDVPDMRDVTSEAYELIEHGLITEADFRDFVFANPARLWTGMNPDFFKGTRVEAAVASLAAT
jgi:predicted TIM-barrel fold metal-dependent hydrolase